MLCCFTHKAAAPAPSHHAGRVDVRDSPKLAVAGHTNESVSDGLVPAASVLSPRASAGEKVRDKMQAATQYITVPLQEEPKRPSRHLEQPMPPVCGLYVMQEATHSLLQLLCGSPLRAGPTPARAQAALDAAVQCAAAHNVPAVCRLVVCFLLLFLCCTAFPH